MGPICSVRWRAIARKSAGSTLAATCPRRHLIAWVLSAVATNSRCAWRSSDGSMVRVPVPRICAPVSIIEEENMSEPRNLTQKLLGAHLTEGDLVPGEEIDLTAPQPEEPPDEAEMERLAAIGARYGAEILGPPPGQ